MKTTRIKILIVLTIAVLLTACNSNGDKADGYGNFEATEITISAENTGKLVAFTIDEGTVVEHNQLIGYIDTIPLYLKKSSFWFKKRSLIPNPRASCRKLTCYRPD